MKNFWNGMGIPRLTGKYALVLSLIAAFLFAAFSTAGVANAQSAPKAQLHFTVSHHVATSHGLKPYGSNGQQLALWVGSRSGIESVVVNGMNQYGNGATNCYPDYSTNQIPLDQWNYYGGYWWVGTVGLQYFSGPGCTGNVIYSEQINVPTFAWGDYTCFAIGVYLGNPVPGTC